MASARLENCGAPYSMRNGPTRSMIPRSTGSHFFKWSIAFRMPYRFTTNENARANKVRTVFRRDVACNVSFGELLLDCNPEHFIFPIAQQTPGPNKCARGIVLVKVGLINVVECLVVLQIAAKYLHRDDVIHGQPGLLYGGLYALHDELRFLLRICRCLPRFGIEPNVPGNVERIADQNAIAERQRFSVRGPRLDDVFPVGGTGDSTRDEQDESN